MDRSIKGTGEKVFQVIICVILFFLSFNAVMPFILLISSSVTAEDALLRYGYGFWRTSMPVALTRMPGPTSNSVVLNCRSQECR